MGDTRSPAGCPSKPPKPASAWWMNQDQYEASACRCEKTAGHDGEHACEHITWPNRHEDDE